MHLLGNLEYLEGQIYKCELDGCITNLHGYVEHMWDDEDDEDDEDRWENFFDKIFDARVNVFIFGDEERGDEVIAMLESHGGINTHIEQGNLNSVMYYINPSDNCIYSERDVKMIEALKIGRNEITLPRI